MASKVERQHFANYLVEAKSWETNKVRELQKSTKTAWMITIAAGVLALISAVTVAILGPQKTAVPYVIRVDNATGSVDIVTALIDGKTTYDEALNKYHLQWYVRWREGFSKNLVNEYYQNVGIMSTPAEQGKYAALMSPKNSQSPLNVYADGSANIKIKSTSFINEKIALVRYTKEVTAGPKAGTTHWAATITFEYVGTPMLESSRAINPLGFQVVEYRNDPDQAITDSVVPASVPNVQHLPISSSQQAAIPAVPSIQ